MAVSSGIKFRCYPTNGQKKKLSEWMGCQRVIYNAKVAEDRYFRTFARKSLSLAGTVPPVDQKYSQFKDKELTGYLYDVPAQILRNGATRFMGSYSRYRKGLAGRPVFRKRYGKNSVWITSELFRFEDTGRSKAKQGKTIYDRKLVIGKGKHFLGELKFNAHDEYELPATITVSRQGGKWFLSFSYEKHAACVPESERIEYYSSLPGEKLDESACGIDRGVAVPVALSDGSKFDYSAVQKERMERKERRKKRYQRIMARRIKRSKRRERAAGKAARCSLYLGNVRNDFAHQTSRKLVNSPHEIFVFEDLKTRNMTKAPAPKTDAAGMHIKNGRRAKAGLNAAILRSSWGKVKLYTTYKARRANKLVINVAPHHTSQECSKCSHTHPDNRHERVFECRNCGTTADADINAAMVIKRRGIEALVSGEIAVRQPKRVMRLRKKGSLGQELAKEKRGEKDVRRVTGSSHGVQPSVNRETPTTTGTPV